MPNQIYIVCSFVPAKRFLVPQKDVTDGGDGGFDLALPAASCHLPVDVQPGFGVCLRPEATKLSLSNSMLLAAVKQAGQFMVVFPPPHVMKNEHLFL